MIIKYIRTLFLMMVLCLSYSGIVLAQENPTVVIEQGMKSVLAVVQDASLEDSVRREKMRGLIGQTFDFKVMSRSILARNWKKASTEQRVRFVSLFKVLLENTYMTAIESYTSETVSFGKERIKGKRATVGATIVLPGGAQVPLQFKLLNSKAQWVVYDVVIEGVSLVSNFRSNFRSIVKRNGIDGLLAQLEKKVG